MKSSHDGGGRAGGGGDGAQLRQYQRHVVVHMAGTPHIPHSIICFLSLANKNGVSNVK